MPVSITTKPDLDARAFDDLAAFTTPSLRSSIWQLATSLAAYVAGWALMLWTLKISYVLTLLLAVPVAGIVVRLFIIFHDCGHGSFFRSGRANRITGAILGVLILTPYDAWRRRHAAHHAATGNLDGDRSLGTFQTLTVDEYRSLTPFRRFAYRFYRHPFVLFGIGATFYFMIAQRIPQDVPKSYRKVERRSVLGTDLGIIVAVSLALWLFGWRRFLLVQLPISVITSAAGMWLFFIQHQFETAYWRRKEDWNFYSAAVYGSSHYDLPRVLHWFTGNIGFHHVHHVNSRIPNYRLEASLAQNTALSAAPKITLGASFQYAWLALWDEARGVLVGFPPASS